MWSRLVVQGSVVIQDYGSGWQPMIVVRIMSMKVVTKITRIGGRLVAQDSDLGQWPQ